MAITESTITQGTAFTVISGKNPMQKRIMPYTPILSNTPARITEPAVGASTCASGSHVCTGNMGTLMANATKKAKKPQNWMFEGKPAFCSVKISKVMVPDSRPYQNTTAKIATSMSTEPVNV